MAAHVAVVDITSRDGWRHVNDFDDYAEQVVDAIEPGAEFQWNARFAIAGIARGCIGIADIV